MKNLAKVLAKKGFVLRSGGADGSDTAFELGCREENGKCEIYLPSEGFNKNQSDLFEPSSLAYEIAAKYHPSWFRLSLFSKKLMARNVHQVLGADCQTPTLFVVCYTKDGATSETTIATGGTGQAIRIASDLNIPVFNLHNAGTLDNLRKHVNNLHNENKENE